MAIKVLLTSATVFEIDHFIRFLEQSSKKKGNFYFHNEYIIFPLITGPGAINMCFETTRCFALNTFDIALNVGIGGHFNPEVPAGTLYNITRDRFADIGAELSDGSFMDIFEMQLLNKNESPYQDGWLHSASKKWDLSLPEATGITVNTVSGSQSTIQKIISRYSPDVESMEGAAFFYTCKKFNTDTIQLRSISNTIEPRNTSHWNIPLAIRTLNDYLITLFTGLL